MLIDTFTFYNELKMLDFRLKELDSVVDYFVIVEATFTHKGRPKELCFENNKQRYSQYLDKIIHIVVEDMPNTQNAWDNENHQRRCISRGIAKLNLSDDDIIIVSDADETPDTKTLKKIKNDKLNGVFNLEQDLYYYNLTCRHNRKWYHAKIMNYKSYVINNKDPEKIRLSKCPSIQNGGWHFSYFGDTNFIQNKLKNFSHQELNSPEFTDKQKIKESITKGRSLFDREKSKLKLLLEKLRLRRNRNRFKKIKIEKNKYLPNNYELLCD